MPHVRRDHVRERREVTAGADRALLRDLGHEACVEERDQLVHERLAHAGHPLQQAIEAQNLRDAHDVVRHRRADADAVREHEVRLELAQVLTRDRDALQLAEACRDPIDHVAPRHPVVDHAPRGAHAIHT